MRNKTSSDRRLKRAFELCRFGRYVKREKILGTAFCARAVMKARVQLFFYLSLDLFYAFCAKWNYTFPPLIYSAESSVGFGRREEGTQHTAKLQLSAQFVGKVVSTHFVKTCMSERLSNAIIKALNKQLIRYNKLPPKVVKHSEKTCLQGF